MAFLLEVRMSTLPLPVAVVGLAVDRLVTGAQLSGRQHSGLEKVGLQGVFDWRDGGLLRW